MSNPRVVEGPIVVRNVTCCYCGKPLEPPLVTTKDHVIGRRFVPTGSLDGCWNVILQACSICNGIKSDLEDDISAISMQPDAFGRFPVEHPSLAADAARKAAGSLSRLTSRPVAKSHQENTFHSSLGPSATFSFTTVGPPQVSDERAWDLARYQVGAFFYYITYKPEQRRGVWWPGAFMPLPVSGRSDWGNPFNMAFMHAVAEWQPRLVGTTASGFFKVAIRRFAEAELWSFALEWNHNFRVVGFLGDSTRGMELASTFPRLQFHVVSQTPKEVVRFREEVPLKEEQDILFSDPHLQHNGTEGAG